MPAEERRGALIAHTAVLAAGVLFGTTFVVVKDAIAEAPPLSFLAVRFGIGAVALVPLARRRAGRPGEIKAGVLCGLALGTGYVFQTIGLQYTKASVSAFVTYLLVVLVPIISALVLRRVPTPTVLIGVALATAGLVLLTGAGAGFHKGEALTLGCAVAFAVHVVLLSELSPRFDAIRLNAVQLAVVGIGCVVPGLATGGFNLSLHVWLAAAYTGVAVSSVALGLQVWGQGRIGPSRTSLLLMVEPVAAAALGWALGERLGMAGAVGSGLILGGIVVSELPILRRHPLDRPATTDDTGLDLTRVSEPLATKEPHG